MEDDAWAKAIIIHLTGKPQDPTSMLLKIINDIRSEGYVAGLARSPQPTPEMPNV
jgi:hypothetical protein